MAYPNVATGDVAVSAINAIRMAFDFKVSRVARRIPILFIVIGPSRNSGSPVTVIGNINQQKNIMLFTMSILLATSLILRLARPIRTTEKTRETDRVEKCVENATKNEKNIAVRILTRGSI